MPPKVSQLLTRVLAREHDDDGSSSSSSEDDYGLQQMAANASAGLKMGEWLRTDDDDRLSGEAGTSVDLNPQCPHIYTVNALRTALIFK